MKRRRFVIGVGGLSSAEDKLVREYISEQGAWWHWISNLWLMTTKNEEISAGTIRDEILKVNQKARVIVFEFPEDLDWAASASTNSSGKGMADWLRQPWGSD
jgi:hypothetical protein